MSGKFILILVLGAAFLLIMVFGPGRGERRRRKRTAADDLPTRSDPGEPWAPIELGDDAAPSREVGAAREDDRAHRPDGRSAE